LRQFSDLLAIILIIAAGLALLIGDPRDSIIILVIVLINATIGFVQEYRAEKILLAFKKHLPSFSKVIRSGRLTKILTVEIVPGDILVLEAGDSIGADARLFEVFDLKTNDFSLTGESHPQKKKVYQIKNKKSLAEINNMVFSGTSVAEGEAKAIVVKTGMQTEFGKIAQTSQEVKEEPTPLQKELIHTGKTVGKIATAVAILTLFLLYLLGRDIKESFLFAIAAGVAMVPEGLPAAISVALSLGAQRMLKKKALVKNLLHVESLGSVDTICTDKTGTLTTGQMVITKSFPDFPNLSSSDKEIFNRVLILCNNAILNHQPVGDPLEIALLKFVENQKIDINQLKKSERRIFEVPFSAKRKKMTVVCQNQGKNYAYTKGAPLELLEICQNITDKEKIIQANDQMAKSGLRVLAVAYKELPARTKLDHESLEKDLHFLGLVGIQDPPREGVAEAIETCQKAQIKTIMVTGDYGLTALAIAKQIGLANDNTKVMTGQDLHQMDNQALKEILKQEIIFARIEPEQKLRIVQNLQQMGQVVAVTGDGVNDVPALVKADIGIAMGQIGTDVTKEAADMVLLDDHFATIVNAVREGRRILDNAKKFVFYVFSSNSGELMAPLFGILLGLPLPLIAIQILAIDLGTDIFPSLALGIEKEEAQIMSRPARPKTERIMNIGMLSHLLQIGLVMGILGIIIFIFSLYQGGWRWGEFLSTDSTIYFRATASVYASLVFCQIANAFSCRNNRLSVFKIGFFSNPWLIWAEIISLLMLVGVIGFSPLQAVFRTAWPTLATWVLIISSALIFLGIFEDRKRRINLRDKNQA